MHCILLYAGHATGLKVLPGGGKYVLPEPTTLKLREKFFSFSGDDCTIRDTEGRDWFKGRTLDQ